MWLVWCHALLLLWPNSTTADTRSSTLAGCNLSAA
jgi:hypothetical protein